MTHTNTEALSDEAEQARIRISYALYGEGNDPGHPLHAVTDALIAVASAKFKRPEPLFAFRDVVENGDGTANLVSALSRRSASNTGRVEDNPTADRYYADIDDPHRTGLASLMAPAVEAEPVAWLCNGMGSGWIERDKITFDREAAEHMAAQEVWTVVPLYIHPSSPAAEAALSLATKEPS